MEKMTVTIIFEKEKRVLEVDATCQETAFSSAFKTLEQEELEKVIGITMGDLVEKEKLAAMLPIFIAVTALSFMAVFFLP